jgi:3-hydroxyisobutyrate dehydrogenase-like beta-hydroxyacid dehydrogenase
MKVGFIGLGSMGLPMAENLLRAGHEVMVYNRTGSRADNLAKQGARVGASPREAAAGVEVLISMLSDDEAVETLILANKGATEGLGSGAIHLSMSTISPELSRRLAEEHRARGQVYVSAPVFGRPEAAREAKLWIVAAGPEEAIERCRPLFEALGQGTDIVGAEPVKANVVKLAGNFLLASALEAIGEAFALVRKHGLDPSRFLEIVNGRLLRSPVYQNYGTMIASERYQPAGFKLAHGLKDMKLVLGAADEVTTPLPLASLIRDHFLTAVAQGWKNLDWAALAHLSAVSAGLSPARPTP